VSAGSWDLLSYKIADYSFVIRKCRVLCRASCLGPDNYNLKGMSFLQIFWVEGKCFFLRWLRPLQISVIESARVEAKVRSQSTQSLSLNDKVQSGHPKIIGHSHWSQDTRWKHKHFKVNMKFVWNWIQKAILFSSRVRILITTLRSWFDVHGLFYRAEGIYYRNTSNPDCRALVTSILSSYSGLLNIVLRSGYAGFLLHAVFADQPCDSALK
jgi:hypothetical protein